MTVKVLGKLRNANYFNLFWDNHCIKNVRIQSYSGPHFSRIFPHSDWLQRDTCILRISPCSVRMRENAGKMRTRITPNTDTFYAVNVTKKVKSLEVDQPKLLRKRGGPKKLEDFYGFAFKMNQRTFTASIIMRLLITWLIASKKDSIIKIFRNMLCYKKSFWKQPRSNHSMCSYYYYYYYYYYYFLSFFKVDFYITLYNSKSQLTSTSQENSRKTQIENSLQIHWCNKSPNHFVSMSVSTFQWRKI